MYNRQQIVINANNIGIKFNLPLNKYTTFKQFMMQRKISKKEFWALQNVSFTVKEKEVLGIIGANGAGKSTLLKVIAGILTPDIGKINVSGRISSLLSISAGFQPELSGSENIYLIGMLRGMNLVEVKNHFAEIVNFAELGEFIKLPIKLYSSGMKARLGFSIATHLKCDTLLIDEILGVGDQDFREKSQKKIRELIKKNHTVILASHNMKAILNFSTQVIWLHKGVIEEYGEPKKVVKAYQDFISKNS